ncbi:MAG TPA: hypothetical protein VHZ51_15375, partial [Ktedonobacteraceae bacterium]|nr:hypothetical protein [Ktedonobacteraceae bacterium]
MAPKRTRKQRATPTSETPTGRSRRTPTFLLELPLEVGAGRQFYNAMLSEGQKRLHQMRADPAWAAARAIPRTQQPARNTAFSALRQKSGFS